MGLFVFADIGHDHLHCLTHLFGIFEKIRDMQDLSVFQRELYQSVDKACERFHRILKGLDMAVPQAEEKDFEVLRSSVNPTRLKNHPVGLGTEDIDRLYRQILSGGN